ncbi:hypothetical protein [Thermosporothrix hazakensis]|jgi:hypothetical protein|nr:hypothetical protein [Thermosporothrix hazakensis]
MMQKKRKCWVPRWTCLRRRQRKERASRPEKQEMTQDTLRSSVVEEQAQTEDQPSEQHTTEEEEPMPGHQDEQRAEERVLVLQDEAGNQVPIVRRDGRLFVDGVSARMLQIAPLDAPPPQLELMSAGGVLVRMTFEQYAQLVGPLSRDALGRICASLDQLLIEQAEEAAELERGETEVQLMAPIFCGGKHPFVVPLTHRAVITASLSRPRLYLLQGRCMGCESLWYAKKLEQYEAAREQEREPDEPR